VSTNAPELTCQELVEIITDYLEGALPPRERERFDAHLGDCDGCVAYLEQMRTTIRLIGALTEDHVAPAAREHLLRLFRDWNRG
jgi:anti-sigma factor RsiW